MKTAALWILAAIVAAALCWLGTYGYWHLRIQRAIRTLDRPGPLGEVVRATDILESAGCRSLPYLIQAIDPEREQSWIWREIRATAGMIASSGPMETIVDHRFTPSLDLLEVVAADPGPSAAKRREQQARLQSWWNSDGSLYHQWWRVWSSRCVP